MKFFLKTPPCRQALRHCGLYLGLGLAAAAAPQAAAAQSGAKTQAAPAVIYDMSRLPAPARHMRARLLQAAKSGDIEALRPLLSGQSGGTRITPAGVKQDPIAYLKQLSADGGGLEILADLTQILQSGAVKQTADGQTVYLFPYFAALSPRALTRAQTVEAYEIMSADDLDTIKEIGRYIYFRAGISPDGVWRFFLTGDDSAAAAAAAETPAGETAEDAGGASAALPNRAALPSPDDAGSLPEE